MNNLNKIGQILYALPFGIFGLFILRWEVKW